MKRVRKKTQVERLDERTTRWLAHRAQRANALGGYPENFEFLLDEPGRYDEVLEFTRWLAGP